MNTLWSLAYGRLVFTLFQSDPYCSCLVAYEYAISIRALQHPPGLVGEPSEEPLALVAITTFSPLHGHIFVLPSHECG
jgi:hypothetical protein